MNDRTTAMDKARLAAFADGELSPEDAAAVVMHLADHPADQAWLDDLMASNALLARAYAGPATEPVPERFRTLILPDQGRVVPFRRRRIWPMIAGLGIAAAMAGLVVLVQPAGDAHLVAGPVPADSTLDRILSSQPSATPVDYGSGTLTILATMPAATGYCREIELLDASTLNLALACRADHGWTVDVALAETMTPMPGGEGFALASGEEPVALDPWLAARQAGLAIPADDEARLIAGGWRD